jgi:hypothetical protein
VSQSQSNSFISEVIVAAAYLAAVSYLMMLVFGILHSYWGSVPAFGYWATLAMFTVFRLILISVSRGA